MFLILTSYITVHSTRHDNSAIDCIVVFCVFFFAFCIKRIKNNFKQAIYNHNLFYLHVLYLRRFFLLHVKQFGLWRRTPPLYNRNEGKNIRYLCDVFTFSSINLSTIFYFHLYKSHFLGSTHMFNHKIFLEV